VEVEDPSFFNSLILFLYPSILKEILLINNSLFIFYVFLMSIVQELYIIETQQGIAKLIHTTPESDGYPILMVHGFGSNAKVWFNSEQSLGNFFIDQKLDCWALQLSKAISGNIQQLANEELLSSLNHIYKKRQRPVVIIGHSMGGIISRVLTSPNFQHPNSLVEIEKKIGGIALLTVPNHGVGPNDLARVEEMVNLIQNVLKGDSDIRQRDLGLGFIQLISSSNLVNQLNSSPVLNPKISWINAVGTHDRVVPIESAKFSKSEVEGAQFIQQEFPCDHMYYPFSNTIQKMIQLAKPMTTGISRLESFLKIYSPIHRCQEVGEWILDNLIYRLDYDAKFDHDLKKKYVS
jgi:hypothetical protein